MISLSLKNLQGSNPVFTDDSFSCEPSTNAYSILALSEYFSLNRDVLPSNKRHENKKWPQNEAKEPN